jgi:hypothetical protein
MGEPIKLVTRRKPLVISETIEYRLLSGAGHTVFASNDKTVCERSRDQRAAKGVRTRIVEAITIVRECE